MTDSLINILKMENIVLNGKIKILLEENDILRRKLGMKKQKDKNNKKNNLFVDNDVLPNDREPVLTEREKDILSKFIDNVDELEGMNNGKTNQDYQELELEEDFFKTLREVKAEMKSEKKKKIKANKL